MPDPRASRIEPTSKHKPPESGGDPPSPTVRHAGLCNRCCFQRDIVSDRGSVFVMCERSAEDQQYVRYPTLPVWRCPGFELRVDG